MHKALISATLVLTLAFVPVHAALAATSVKISEDRFSNPDAQHQTQVEPDSYAFGSTIVATMQTGRFFTGATDVAWATSLDGGSTWTDGDLPGISIYTDPPGPYFRVVDPSVVYDAEHDVWIISTLATSSVSGDVLVSRSTDGGLTWDDPVVVSGDPAFGYDKDWIVCDNTATSPFYGNCYVTWDDSALGDRLYNSTSTDGGLTWGPKLTTANNDNGFAAQPLVQPSGRVIVPVTPASTFGYLVYASTNGGTTWTRTHLVELDIVHRVAGGLRWDQGIPSAEIDAAGTVYLVSSSCRFRIRCSSNDIVMTTSIDGRHWTPVVRIPIDGVTSGMDHFLPGLAVDRNSSGATARLALTYYFYPDATCTYGSCRLMVGFISSADGGATWSLPETVAGPISLSWIANSTTGRFVGDYISTSFAGDAVGVFSNAFAPSGGLYDQAMFAVVSPVSYDGLYPLAVRDEPVLSFQSDDPLRTMPISEPALVLWPGSGYVASAATTRSRIPMVPPDRSWSGVAAG
jgi:hypothetical protein